ncbi:MAG: sensor histidine kinase [Dissulfurispiraceae bacterium]
MKITTALKINSLLTAVVVIIMGIIFTVSFVLRQDTMKMDTVAMGIVTGVFELNALNNSYLSRPEDRPLEQWKLKQMELLQRIKNSPIQNNEQRVLLKRIDDNLTAMGKLFQRIESSYESGITLQGSSEENRLAEQQLVRLMSLYSLDLVRDASQLSEENHKKVAAVNRIIWLFIPASALVMVGIAMWFSAVLIRRIGKPFAQLSAGAEIIGSGNLDYRFGIRSNDEVGDLASAFDSMTTSLKQITVSRDELAGEIEERKRTENVIVELNQSLAARNSELVAANQELEAFSYSVSHDLRAPLRHISSYLELLTKEMDGEAGDRAKRYMSVIAGASNKMGLLIDDLLAFSRMGRKDMEKTIVDIPAIIKDVIRGMAPDIKGRDAEWEIGSLPNVYGDTSMLQLAIVNLISNATKYTAPCSKAKIEIGCKEEADEFIFFVKDNGVGFDMKYVDKLFGVFQRLHHSDEFEGTGIGLANVRRIISRHGGRTWAEGAVGQGAVFYFTIPKNKEI